MNPQDDESALTGRFSGAPALWRRFGHSVFARYAARKPSVLIAFIVCGFLVGLGYRLAFDRAVERTLPDFCAAAFTERVLA